jgi:hypothetical protein
MMLALVKIAGRSAATSSDNPSINVSTHHLINQQSCTTDGHFIAEYQGERR